MTISRGMPDRGLSPALPNNALELAGSTRNGHLGPRSSTQCYPDVSRSVILPAALLLLLSVAAAAGPQQPLIATLDGPATVVLGEPLRLSVILRARSDAVLVSTQPHLSIQRVGSPSYVSHSEVPCGDILYAFKEVLKDHPLVLPTWIHVATTGHQPNEPTGDPAVRLAFSLPGRYRIRSRTDAYSSNVRLPKGGDPDFVAKAKALLAQKPFGVESPALTVEVRAPNNHELAIFRRYVLPHPGVLLGGSCDNPIDRARAAELTQLHPDSRYVHLLLGRAR